MIFSQHVAADLATLGFALGATLGANDAGDLRRDHVPVRVHRDQEATALEREADAATRRCRPGGAAQPQRLAFEIEELFRVHLAAYLLDGAKELALHGREGVDFFVEANGVVERFPSRLQGERQRRRRRAAQVVGRNGRGHLRGAAGDERPGTPRVVPFPGTELHYEGDGQQQLDLVSTGRTCVHDAAGHEGLHRWRQALHHQNALGLGDAKEQLSRGARELTGVPRLGQRHQGAGDLGRRVDALRLVDT